MNRQTILRIWHSIRLYTILSSGKRADYLRKHNIFHHLGNNCTIVERKIPLCSRLISVGDNVHLATGVLLVTHDAIHLCLNNLKDEDGEQYQYKEKMGCIDIGNDVFIGANTIVLYDVKIGSKVIIGAGSLVNKDIPNNSVAVGVPAKVIGTFDSFMKKRKESEQHLSQFTTYGHSISSELETYLWEEMDRIKMKEIR